MSLEANAQKKLEQRIENVEKIIKDLKKTTNMVLELESQVNKLDRELKSKIEELQNKQSELSSNIDNKINIACENAKSSAEEMVSNIKNELSEKFDKLKEEHEALANEIRNPETPEKVALHFLEQYKNNQDKPIELNKLNKIILEKSKSKALVEFASLLNLSDDKDSKYLSKLVNSVEDISLVAQLVTAAGSKFKPK